MKRLILLILFLNACDFNQFIVTENDTLFSTEKSIGVEKFSGYWEFVGLSEDFNKTEKIKKSNMFFKLDYISNNSFNLNFCDASNTKNKKKYSDTITNIRIKKAGSSFIASIPYNYKDKIYYQIIFLKTRDSNRITIWKFNKQFFKELIWDKKIEGKVKFLKINTTFESKPSLVIIKDVSFILDNILKNEKIEKYLLPIVFKADRIREVEFPNKCK
jgi:hypothetical protein